MTHIPHIGLLWCLVPESAQPPPTQHITAHTHSTSSNITPNRPNHDLERCGLNSNDFESMENHTQLQYISINQEPLSIPRRQL